MEALLLRFNSVAGMTGPRRATTPIPLSLGLFQLPG